MVWIDGSNPRNGRGAAGATAGWRGACGARLSQSRVTYYFQNDSPETTLAAQLPYVLTLARAARDAGPDAAIRHHGEVLERAADLLVRQIGNEFLDLRDTSAERILAALKEDHLLRDRARG